jgi:hypothetical protein
MYLVAIFGFIATNVLMGCDIWILWPPKTRLHLLKKSLQQVGVNTTVKMVVAFMGSYCPI